MTILDDNQTTQRLAQLIAAKLQLVELLARLSRRQLDLIDGGDMAALVKLLAAKQTVLERLQAVERQLDPFRHEDPEQRVWRSADERTACQLQAERCNKLLAESLELEQQAEAAMIRRRDAAAGELTLAQGAADARVAYAALPSASPPVWQVEG